MIFFRILEDNKIFFIHISDKKAALYKIFVYIVIFEIFVKSMTSSLSESNVTPSFFFTFKIPNDMTATKYLYLSTVLMSEFMSGKNDM